MNLRKTISELFPKVQGEVNKVSPARRTTVKGLKTWAQAATEAADRTAWKRQTCSPILQQERRRRMMMMFVDEQMQ